jgi:Tfp pilus assembly protein PilN
VTDFQKNINLLPKEEIERTPIGKFLQWALTFGRYIVIFTELIVIIAFIYRFKLDRDLNKVNNEIKQKTAIIESQQEFEHTVRVLQPRLSLVKEIEALTLIPSGLLNELAQIIPLDLVIFDLQANSKTIMFQGASLSKVGLATFIHGLQTSNSFTNISINSISTKGRDNPTLNFSLTANLTKTIK